MYNPLRLRIQLLKEKMKAVLRMFADFFGFNGYTRVPEGYLSWQHLTFVSSLMAVMVALAVVLGKRNRNKSNKKRNKVLIIATILMELFEISKIVLKCTVGGNPRAWLQELPLYMCSIQLITLPLASFAKGRIREAALDFVCMFGVLGAVLGTYGAGQNYACYPVLSFDNVNSGLTHSIAGFSSLYIMISGMASMKKENSLISHGIIIAFGIVAYCVNLVLETNYMFLVRGDGTPYDILFNLVSGNKVLYPLGVIVLFILYMICFRFIFVKVLNRKKAK